MKSFCSECRFRLRQFPDRGPALPLPPPELLDIHRCLASERTADRDPVTGLPAVRDAATGGWKVVAQYNDCSTVNHNGECELFEPKPEPPSLRGRLARFVLWLSRGHRWVAEDDDAELTEGRAGSDGGGGAE